MDFGNKTNLTGITLGADYDLSDNFKVGGLLNIGQGNSTGKDAATGMSNDFKYWGLGAYLGLRHQNIRALADISYTVVDNDVEANTTVGTSAVDKLSSSFDTTNFSLGLTGMLDLELAPNVMLSPHVGLRYQSINTDDYTVKDSAGNSVGSYQSDRLNLWSLPIGTTIAAQYQLEDWQIRPSFDLTLTTNFGDTDSSGRFQLHDITNTSAINVSSETFDNFNYGATLMVEAIKDNVSLGIGLNYTGSSHRDDIAIQAQGKVAF